MVRAVLERSWLYKVNNLAFCHQPGKLEREMLSLLKATARRMEARHWDDLADKVVSHQPEELWLWVLGDPSRHIIIPMSLSWGEAAPT